MGKDKLRRCVFWAGPALVCITVFGWEKPVTDFPPQMPLLFRIVGVAGGLLTCVGCLWGFTGRNKIDLIASLAIGMFGIGIAGWFCLDSPQKRAPVYRLVGISQALWLIFVLCWNLTSKMPRERRALRKQINAELKKIFPPRDLYLATVSAWACGLCAIGFVTLFVWSVLVTRPQTYFTHALPLQAAWSCCLLGVPVLAPLAALTNLTKAAFVKKPNPGRGGLRVLALGSGFFGILACLLMGTLAGDKAFWLIGPPSCLLWVAICWLWYKHSLKVAERAGKSDYRRRIREIAAQNREAGFDTLGSDAFVPEVVTTDEGLKVANVAGEALYPWEDIKYIHLYHNGSSAAVVNKHERCGIGQLSVSEGLKTRSKQMEQIWASWLDKIESKEDIHEFEYPQWSRDRDARQARDYGILMTVCAIFIFAIAFFLLLRRQDASGNELGASAGFFLFGLVPAGVAGYFFRESRKKRLRNLYLREGKITVYYDDGSTAQYDIEDITEYRCRLYADGAEIIFRDGTTFKNLDRVSYWPVLRERLQIHLQQRPAK
ncbi:MAG: hypothetical protein ACYTBJ_13620 [Planctomycetota bacterium]